MSPRWLHWPDAGASPSALLDISGTVQDANAGDGVAVPVANMTASIGSLPTGISNYTVRLDKTQVCFTFDTSTNASNFKTAYPATGYWRVTYDVNDEILDFTVGRTIITGWSYVNQAGNPARPSLDWDEMSADGSGTSPTGFTFPTKNTDAPDYPTVGSSLPFDIRVEYFS